MPAEIPARDKSRFVDGLIIDGLKREPPPLPVAVTHYISSRGGGLRHRQTIPRLSALVRE